MGFDIQTTLTIWSILPVMAQGVLSFFSPCVLPLVPLYLSYLAGGAPEAALDKAARRRTLVNTFFFVLGISFAFFLLGMGFTALGQFFSRYRTAFTVAGGIVVLLMGVWQLFFGGISTKELRLPFRLDKWTMGPIPALVMGFTFSFAWTPCVGPALASVLIMAASASTRGAGMGLIGIYTLGFVLPFLAVGFFTTSLLEFFKTHMNVVRYTVKIGGILMIIMGILMFTGKMNSVTGYLSRISGQAESSQTAPAGDGQTSEGQTPQEPLNEDSDSPAPEGPADAETLSEGPETGISPSESSGETERGASPEKEESGEAAQSEEEIPIIPALDFTLKDQYGNTHSLSDYEGKTIFLNFWGTWCPPCRAEMPEIQKLYENYSREGEDALIVLGVAAPGMSGEGTEEEIAAFLEENGYTYPVLMDSNWELFLGYGITSFPTTFMIDREGNLFGYVSGQLSYDIMESIVQQTMEGR